MGTEITTIGPADRPGLFATTEGPIVNPVRILVTTALAVGTVLLSAAAASAAMPAPGPSLGQHVSDCASTMGFSGTHNPGVMLPGAPIMFMDMSAWSTT